jgi:hypothetical protein
MPEMLIPSSIAAFVAIIFLFVGFCACFREDEQGI